MNKLFLMKNPDLFQGEKYLNTNKNYFEGWYFKNTNHERGVSFIPGINIDGKDRKAFIQVITADSSYFVNYDISNFKFNFNPFCVKISNNIFSKNGIHIDIKDNTQNINVHGDIKYSNSKCIDTSFFCPNIMGPFSFVPFMECNHAILSMQNCVNGFININDDEIIFNNDFGYIEKDWRCSFPKSYIWCQGNNFQKFDVSFMISIVNVPFKLLTFKGIICVLMVDNEEYKFTTYNNAKLIKYDISESLLCITLQKGSYCLSIKSAYDKGLKLFAPNKGRMENDIFESISSSIEIILRKDDVIIFSDKSTNCGVEIVTKME